MATGASVANGTIDTTDAQYSLQSVVAGGFSTIFDANKGVINGIPPGAYVVLAKAFCKIDNRWVQSTSAQITMTGTYPGFDQNRMDINTADIVNSMECSPTGVIPVQLGSGRTPYTVLIVESPDPELVGREFSSDVAGVLKIEDLTWGNYVLALSDACEYRIERNPTISKIEPKYRVTNVEGSPACMDKGKIHLLMEDGTLPYSIELTSVPERYSGSTTLTVEQDGPYVIENLPKGTYEFTIGDACIQKSFSETISESEFEAFLTQGKSSAPCVSEGEILFTISGGAPPYTISLDSYSGDDPDDPNTPDAPRFDPMEVTSSQTTVRGLPPGNYTFLINDYCNNESTNTITIASSDFEMEIIDITVASSCKTSNGRAVIKTKGGATPYVVTLVRDGTDVTPTDNMAGPTYWLDDLSAGNYQFTITDLCNRSITEDFTIARERLIAAIHGVVNSVEMSSPSPACGVASGEIVLDIVQGAPEYTLILSRDGEEIDQLGPSGETSYKFEYLSPGTYDISVTDGCGDVEIKEDVEIGSFGFGVGTGGSEPVGNSLVGANIYDDYFAPAQGDNGCNKVVVRRKQESNTDFNKFWRDNPQLFEVAFVPDNNPTSVWSWVDVADEETFTLDESYCEARLHGRSYTVYARMKVAEPDCSDTLVDVIRFPDSGSSISLQSNNCETDVWTIHHDDFMCAPYQIVVTTADGTVETTTVNELSSSKNIELPHGTHTIEVKTGGCTWISEEVSADVPPPTVYPRIGYEGFNCDTYSAYFDFDYHCYPYEWQFRERARPDVVHGKGTIGNSSDDQRENRYHVGLEYGKEYELCIFLNSRVDRCIDVYQETRPASEKYRIDFTPQYCLPDTGKGYIRIYRNIAFEEGAVIRFQNDDDSHTLPRHIEFVVPRDGIREFYPFSLVDSLSAEFADIADGRYSFSIVDSCGREEIISVDYRRSTLRDFGYDRTVGCQKTDIKPHGSIYLGDDKITSYFRIIEVPAGVAPIYDVVTEGGYFGINISGHYVLQISQQSGINSCPFATVGIDFIKENVSLDADATLTYVCDEESDGYIRVRHKGGVGPFTYELFDNGVFIEGQTKGRNEYCTFNYGRYGESYVIRIKDSGCGIEFPTTVYMLDLSRAKIINDDITLCKGEDIKLTCLSVGDYGYNWSGPNEWTSTEQNPVINDATEEMDGRYSITVQPEGCMRNITQYVTVEVLDPRPLLDTTIFFCLNDPTRPLSVTPDRGHYLKWFDTDTVHVASPPEPPTNVVDTFDYFVSQVNSIYGCEGEKSIVRVIIQDFPDTVAYAYAGDICRNGFPLVVIPDTCIFPGYVYRLFNSSGEQIGSVTAPDAPDTPDDTDSPNAPDAPDDTDTPDVSLQILSNESMETSGVVYIEVETRHRCVSTQRSRVPVTVIHPIPPVVHDTLYCLDASVVVPLRADSTSENRLQWYDVDGVAALSSAPEPAVDVAGEYSYWVAQVDTLLGCVGDKAELKVTVQDLPGIDIDASAEEICRRTSPTVTVGTTYSLYTYTLFDKDDEALDSKVSAGSPVTLRSSDYTMSQDGTLYVEVQDEHKCTSRDRAEVPVSVVIPGVPQVFDTLYCLNAVAVPLVATPAEGYYIQWYDLAENPTTASPVPRTNLVDTLYYNVTQKHNALYCESDTVQIQVIVDTLPDVVAYAYAGDICRNDFPLVIIPDTCLVPGYVYRLFSSSGERQTGSGTALANTALQMHSSESLEQSDVVYIEVESDHHCVSADRTEVPITVIHPAPPVVYDTLYCLDAGVVVPLRADSSAGNRLQWYDLDEVTPLSSAPVPAVTVVGEYSYWVVQVDTRLGCVGDRAELKVVVHDLPDINIDASAEEICRRTSPTVKIERTHEFYTYTLFDRDGDTLDSKVSSGNPVMLYSSDYILSQNGTLYVEVQNQQKCKSRDRAEVPVSVVIPQVPQVIDTLYCLNAVAAPLVATPAEGYYIQWYDLAARPTTSPPVPPTNPVDTLFYNATQKHNVLHCESDTVQIRVIISALPEMVTASSPDICPGRHPVIVIPQTLPEMSYSVYSESETFLSSVQGSGDSINIVVPYPIYESTNYFVETMDVNSCVSKDRTKTGTEVVNYMYLLPEQIPSYQRGKLYSVQFTSNAVAPYRFSTDNILPTGFTLSIEGLFSGIFPLNGLIDPVSFRVIVEDVNGCYAAREYILESDIFIPQVYTPNGDGKNDFFMKGRRLVIFDRLGLKIFEGDDGWNGTRFDGTPAPPDTYFYLIYYEDKKLMTQGQKKGYITLIRRRNF
jgi:gliding motility-associated-like protein